MPNCNEHTGKGGNPIPCEDAYEREGCRCEACVSWRYSRDDATEGPAEGSGPPSKPDNAGRARDGEGNFAPTALTRRLDAQIEEAGGRDALYGMVASAMSAREIAEELALDGDDYATRQAIYRRLRSDPDKYDEAKEISAQEYAAKAGEVYGEETPESSADAKWRNDRSGYFRWLAESRSAEFGEQPAQTNVNLVDIGALHLEALKAHGSMADYQDDAVDADYEVVDE